MQALWNYLDFWTRGIDRYVEVSAQGERQVLTSDQCVNDFQVHVEQGLDGAYYLDFSPSMPNHALRFKLTKSTLTPLDNRH